MTLSSISLGGLVIAGILFGVLFQAVGLGPGVSLLVSAGVLLLWLAAGAGLMSRRGGS